MPNRTLLSYLLNYQTEAALQPSDLKHIGEQTQLEDALHAAIAADDVIKIQEILLKLKTGFKIDKNIHDYLIAILNVLRTVGDKSSKYPLECLEIVDTAKITSQEWDSRRWLNVQRGIKNTPPIAVQILNNENNEAKNHDLFDEQCMLKLKFILGFFTKLVTLKIKGLTRRVDVDYDKLMHSFIETIERHPTLQNLEISHAEISVYSLGELIGAIERNIHINSVKLSCVNMENVAARDLVKMLEKKALKHLDVSGNKFDKERFGLICEALAKNIIISSVVFDRNIITLKGLNHLFANNKSLREISLKETELNCLKIKDLSQSLQRHPLICKIDLSGNNIGVEGLKTLLEIAKINLNIVEINIEEQQNLENEQQTQWVEAKKQLIEQLQENNKKQAEQKNVEAVTLIAPVSKDSVSSIAPAASSAPKVSLFFQDPSVSKPKVSPLSSTVETETAANLYPCLPTKQPSYFLNNFQNKTERLFATVAEFAIATAIHGWPVDWDLFVSRIEGVGPGLEFDSKADQKALTEAIIKALNEFQKETNKFDKNFTQEHFKLLQRFIALALKCYLEQKKTLVLRKPKIFLRKSRSEILSGDDFKMAIKQATSDAFLYQEGALSVAWGQIYDWYLYHALTQYQACQPRPCLVT